MLLGLHSFFQNPTITATNEKKIYILVISLVSVTLFLFVMIPFSYPVNTNLSVARPFELLSGLIFLAALIGYFGNQTGKQTKSLIGLFYV